MLAAIIALAAVQGICGGAHAQSVKIVALGASTTNGMGVGRGAAFPAQLEALLRARGIHASVLNEGINGDTSRGMLGRLDSAVPSGTNIVILQKVPGNDNRKRVYDSSANVAAMTRTLQARGITVIVFSAHKRGTGKLLSDGHLNAEGQRDLAARLLPLVLAAMGRRR
jgi:acyl-CoA thioesterase-1